MATLTRDQLRQVLQNAPPGSDYGAIVSRLQQRGHTLDPDAAAEAETSIGSRLREGVKEDFNRRATSIVESRRAADRGEQSHVEGIAQATGQVAGFVGDLAMRTGAEAVKAITPDPVEDAARMVGKSIIESEIGQAGLRAALQGTQAYQDWRKGHMRAAKNLEAVANIGSLLPAAKGGQVAVKGGAAAGKAGARGAVAATRATGRGIARAGGRSLTMARESFPVRKASDLLTPIQPGVERALKPAVQEVAEETAESTALKAARELATEKGAKNVAEELAEEASGVVGAEDKLAKLNRYVKQAEEAVVDYSKDTPLDLAGQEAEKSLHVLQSQLTTIGKRKSEALTGVANMTTDVRSVKNQFLQALRERAGIVLKKDGTFRSAAGRIAKVTDPSDMRMVEEVRDLFTRLGDSPTLQQVDDAVDVVQGALFKRSTPGAIPVNRNVEGILKSTIRNMNQQLRKAANPAYREANDAYATVVEIRNELNKALGRNVSKGGSLMKRIFSPTDSGTKRLFRQVKELTGVDLVEDATFAKFVMEAIGDVRQANLLEQLDLLRFPTKGSLVNQAATRIIRGLQDPVGKARRIIIESQGK